MLIDAYLPVYDVSERHSVLIKASPQCVYAVLRTADLADFPPVRLLLRLRALPAALRGGGSGWHKLRTQMAGSVQLRTLEKQGFAVLAEEPAAELLIGLVGVFWTLRGGLRSVDSATFRGPQLPGTARAAWNFSLEQSGDGGCRLSTETRVQCADPASLKRFRLYWFFVRPGSGLIRRFMLRAIRSEAESARR